MEIFIIGGSKFIGFHLIQRLFREGHRITVLNLEHKTDKFPGSIKYITGDRQDHELVRKKIGTRSFDIVVDMCAFIPEDLFAFLDIFKNKIRQYIMCSTISVYDFDKIRILPITENSPLKQDPASRNDEIRYGSNKVLCENLLLKNNSFPATIIRPTYVYGPLAYDNRVEFFFDRIMDERIIPIRSILNAVAHFVYVDDLVNFFTASIGNSKTYNQVYNIGGTDIVTIENFIHLCEEIIGKNVTIKVYDVVKLLTKYPECYEIQIIKKLYPYSLFFDIKKAREDCCWEPGFSLYDGLKSTYNWYKNNKKTVDYSLDALALQFT